jgi:hypothetical protein
LGGDLAFATFAVAFPFPFLSGTSSESESEANSSSSLLSEITICSFALLVDFFPFEVEGAGTFFLVDEEDLVGADFDFFLGGKISSESEESGSSSSSSSSSEDEEIG